ncbi:hypothetical protein HGB07_03730 [Candidatus Roizmanbacteria bacterium]|nr:hypothetical protein [Candidatus Roizmanbacteria bacterium]
MMNKTIILIVAMLSVSNVSVAKELYRAQSAGDQGSYYILESKELENGILQVLSSRVGKGNAYTDFTKLKVNCITKQYFEIAGGEENGAKDNPTEALKDRSKQSKWTSLVIGSSKYDLVEFVCKKKK